jgi:diguanylate cyclase (GGDEF)-like protein
MERTLKKLLKKINKLLFEDFVDTDSDSNRRIMLTYIVAITGAILLGLYAFFNILIKNYVTFAIDLLCALAFLFVFLRLPKAGNYKKYSLILLTSMALTLLALFAFSKGDSIVTLVWYPLFPFFSIMILGRRRGLNFSVGLLAALLVIYLTIFVMDVTTLSPNVAFALATSYFVTMLLVYYSDMLRHNVTKRLVKSNLELKSAQNKLIKLNKLDQLSGVYNRNYLEEFYGDSDKYNSRRRICMLMMDIDNFKAYNDTYGHINGDKVISAVANVIKNSCREDDIIIRYGGEEFLAILYGRTLEEAEYIANLIIEGVRNLEIEHKLSYTGYVTMSIGLCGSNSNAPIDKWEMIKEADGALYEAKNIGKNCCVIRNYDEHLNKDEAKKYSKGEL